MSKFGMLQLKVYTKIKDSEIIAQRLEVVKEFSDKRNIEMMMAVLQSLFRLLYIQNMASL